MSNTVRWLGHSACEIRTDGGTRILIDPWLDQNPLCPLKVKDVEKLDFVLITHDHFDHVGDAIQLAQNTGAQVVSQPETSARLQGAGLPAACAQIMNPGGTVNLGDCKATMVHAFHTSESGTASGYILQLPDGKNVYHSGDTGIFGDMKLFADIYGIDLALLPIGGRFTMDPLQASVALTLLRPKAVIPLHYKTFPILEQDADSFGRYARERAPAVKLVVPAAGDVHTI